MYLRYFQLNMAVQFLPTKFLKWMNHFEENSQQTRNFSEPKMFQKLVGEPALTV